MKVCQKIIISSLILFWYSSGLLAQEPAVQNVQFIQRADKKVEVTYDLVGKPSRKYAVKLSLVKSGSRGRLSMNQQTLSGDVGEGVSPGRRLRIIWNLPDDYPQGLKGEGFTFIVEVFEQQRGGSKWPWIGGGLAIAGGVVAYIILAPPPPTGSIIIDVPGN